MKLDHGPRRSKVLEIAGVERIRLESHADAGGVSTQVFHREWQLGIHPVQWNAVQSEANTLRGVHVHVVHEDYVVLLNGQALLGLRDLRPGAPTEGNTVVLDLKAELLEAVRIPPGVAHGFYFTRSSLLLNAVSHYWSLADELGCHWADHELRLDWPVREPLLSQRDASAGSLRELVGTLRTRLREAAPS